MASAKGLDRSVCHASVHSRPIHSVLQRNLLRRPHVSDRRGNTIQISRLHLLYDEIWHLMAAIDTVLSAQEAE